MNTSNKSTFSSIGSILVVVSSAIGLGNIWKFPGMAGNNGGALFLLTYIICSFLVSLPILLIEFYVGYKTKKSCFEAIKELSNNNKYWQCITFFSLIVLILISSFYSDVIGWILKYLYYSLTNQFQFSSIEESAELFQKTISSPSSVVICQTIILIIISIISFFGVTKGVESFIKISIPTLLLILIIMGGFSFCLPARNRAISFLFKPDFSKFNGSMLINALGLGLFKVTAGSMVMANYFSYFPENKSPLDSILKILFIDLFTSIFCGLVLFPVIFTYSNEVSGGPGLLFVTSVVLLKKIFLGNVLLFLFFLLAFLAAIGALLSMMQFINRFFKDIFGISERKSIIIGNLLVFLFGLLPTLSTTSILSDCKIFGKDFFDLFDYMSSNVLMPFVGLLLILFVIFVIKFNNFKDFLIKNDKTNKKLITFFAYIAISIAPILVLFVWISNLI